MSCSLTHFGVLASKVAVCSLCLALGLLSAATLASPREESVVLHTLKPLQLITQELAAELVTTTQLIRSTQQAHSYNVRFSDLRQLQAASLVVWMGPEFEHYLSKPLQALHPTIATHSWLTAEPVHEHGVEDVHVWLDVDAVADGSVALAQALSAIRPEKRAELLNQAQQFEQQLRALDGQLLMQLEAVKGKGVVVDHRGLEVFLQRYGIRYLGSLQSDNHSALSLKQAKRLRKEVQLGNAECVVLTQGHSAEGLLQIFSGLEVSTISVDIMGANARSYTELLQHLADDVSLCLTQGKTLR